MFLDNLTTNQLNLIGFISVSIATLMLILTIVLPFLIERQKTNDFTQKCAPKTDNTEIWAKFPGELHSTLNHNYEVFSYSQNDTSKAYEIKSVSNFSIKEEVKYQNITEKDDTIYFNANRTYTYVEDKKKENEETKINSVNMGYFEALETLTNPTLYKTGINSLRYLFSIEPDLFVRELFTYTLFNKLNETIIRENILNNLSEEKIERILNAEDKYSFNNYTGLFQWIRILGLKNRISKASWLSNLFKLTDDEISYILENRDNYLMSEYINYNKELSKTFHCYIENFCGIELVFTQLINGSVTASLKPEVKDFLTLNSILQTNYYPFEKTPEMSFYFAKDYKEKNGLSDKEVYTDYAPSLEQLESLLIYDNCLLSLNNSIYFLYLNKTEDLLKKEKYIIDLTPKQLYFLSDYIYDFLPGLFLYPKIKKGEETLKVDSLAKTVSTMTQMIADKTYKFMNKVNLYDYIMSYFMAENLKKTLRYTTLDELCPLMMQKVLDDGKKVNKICTDKNIGIDSIESLYKWVEPYYCISEKNSTKCNMSVINYLKNLVYVSEDEINTLFGEEYFGGAITQGLDAIKEIYKCGDRCDEKDYLNKLQFLTGIVTSNAPEPLEKTDTIMNWFPDEIPYPIEISYYQKKYDNHDNYTEEDINYIVNLVLEEGDILNLDNSDALQTKLNLEKEYSLYLNSKEKTSLISLIDFLIEVFIINDELNDNKDKQSLFVEYSSLKNLLEGNNKEDKYWINFLSSGNYYENFKPDYNSTTGLDFGLNLETKKQEKFDFDYLGINSKTDNFGKRVYKKMNDLLTLNLKKEEYDFLKEESLQILSPIYNFEKLSGSRKFSDGFQYDTGLDVIYYYDTISSRPLRFVKAGDETYKDKIRCRKYNLDVKDISAGINENYDLQIQNKYAMITQKTNKPYMISPDFNILKKYGYQYNNELKEEQRDNYICVDPISDMVIDSKINLIYGIYSRNYGFVNKIVENEKIYPIFTYQRVFEVEVNSYEEIFPGVTEYYENIIIFIVIGIIVILLFATIAIVAFCYLKKKLKKDPNISLKQSLVALNGETRSEAKDSERKEE